MNFHFYVLLIVTACCNRLYCNTVTTTESLKTVRRSLRMSTTNNDENHMQGKQISWVGVPYSKQNPVKVEDLKKLGNTRVDPTNRKTKILGSLAFLAGLSVGGLANAASASVKTYIKPPPVPPNLDASRLSSHLAAIYNPQVYLPHPYILATPLGFYPLLNLLRLQSIGGTQNDLQTLSQNPHLLDLFVDKRPIDSLNNNDKYIDEVKQPENVKTSSNAQEDAVESVELQVEDVRNAEEKMLASETVCDAQKEYNKMQGGNGPNRALEVLEDPRLSAIPTFRQANATLRNGTFTNATISRNETSTTMSTMQNSTANSNNTIPPFYGYYGGYPQNVNHIDFTTEAHEYKYHDYDHINYNLPSYDKPANFYPDEKYNYFSNLAADSFPPNQFQQEQIPEYFSSDFSRYLYSPENTPPFGSSGFRPVA